MANEQMKCNLTYAEAAEILGVHKQTVSNYVDRGILKLSLSNAKAVTSESVKNLLNQHSDFVEIAREVDKLQSEIEEEKETLLKRKKEVQAQEEMLRQKKVTYQSLDYIGDILCIFFDSFGDKLSKREKEVLKAIVARQDLTTIAQNIGLSRERTRQIFQKSLRRLAMCERAQDLKEENARLKKDVELKDLTISGLNAKIAELDDSLEIQQLLRGSKSAYVSVPAEWMRPLGEVELSVRSYNCLSLMGVLYIADLAFIENKSLARMRNLGSKSLAEIDRLKRRNGMPWARIKDVREINKIEGDERVAVSYVVLEERRKQFEK